MALNVLTKGLIGLVFPIGTIVLYLLLTRNLRHLLRLRLFSSFLVFLAIAAPWHLLAGFRNPAQGEARGFFWFYFVNVHSQSRTRRIRALRLARDCETRPADATALQSPEKPESLRTTEAAAGGEDFL